MIYKIYKRHKIYKINVFSIYIKLIQGSNSCRGNSTQANVYQLIRNNQAEREKQLPVEALGHLAKTNSRKKKIILRLQTELQTLMRNVSKWD